MNFTKILNKYIKFPNDHDYKYTSTHLIKNGIKNRTYLCTKCKDKIHIFYFKIGDYTLMEADVIGKKYIFYIRGLKLMNKCSINIMQKACI